MQEKLLWVNEKYQRKDGRENYYFSEYSMILLNQIAFLTSCNCIRNVRGTGLETRGNLRVGVSLTGGVTWVGYHNGGLWGARWRVLGEGSVQRTIVRKDR